MKKRTIKTTRDKGVKLLAKTVDGVRLPIANKKTKLAKILAQIPEKQWPVDVEVKYQPDVSNSGTFYNWNQINEALLLWLAPDLVDYCTDKKW